MSKYLTFEGPYDLPNGKTKIWHVLTKDTSSKLGQVRWYAPWRRYTFWPNANCVFEQDCLRDIADFVQKKTEAHRKKTQHAEAQSS